MGGANPPHEPPPRLYFPPRRGGSTGLSGESTESSQGVRPFGCHGIRTQRGRSVPRGDYFEPLPSVSIFRHEPLPSASAGGIARKQTATSLRPSTDFSRLSWD